MKDLLIEKQRSKEIQARTVMICLLISVLFACNQRESPGSPTPEDSATSSDLALGLVDAAIAAHGGLDKLKAASTWVAQIRRYQRGNSYVMKNYYRPGMVRLAQDLGDGNESADVIGDPHCWGMRGPVSIPCSPETRENDRPRVIMEIAVQLWPLREEEWVLTSAASQSIDGVRFDTVTARYLPRDTVAEFKFDPDTHLLHSISVRGVKEGVNGTHVHKFSEYKEYCGVQMPSHNEKSFEGDVWVAEDLLELECQPVQESLFLRPQQVAAGAFSAGHADSTWLACTPESTAISSLPEQQERLHTAISTNELRLGGPTHSQILEDGTIRSCAPVEADAAREYEGLVTELSPDTDLLSIFSLQAYDASSSLVDRLRAEVQKRNLISTGPVRLVRYDNDGMGLTGELVVELQLPVEKAQL